MKRGRVVQSVARYPALELVYTEPVAPAQPIIGYRTRAKLIVAPGAKLGLFAKGGGHQVVDIPRCRVLSPVLARVAGVLRAAIADGRRRTAARSPRSTPRGVARSARSTCARSATGTRRACSSRFVVQRGRVSGVVEALEHAARELMQAVPGDRRRGRELPRRRGAADPRQRDGAPGRRRVRARPRRRVGTPGDVRLLRAGAPRAGGARARRARRGPRSGAGPRAGPAAARARSVRRLGRDRARARGGGRQRAPRRVVRAGGDADAAPPRRRRGSTSRPSAPTSRARFARSSSAAPASTPPS